MRTGCGWLSISLWIPVLVPLVSGPASSQDAPAPAGAEPAAPEKPVDLGAEIRELRRRLEALEAAGAAGATGGSADATDRSAGTATPEGAQQTSPPCYRTLDDVLDEIDRLDERFEALPALAGYYDFEYFNDDRSGSPGEFRQHHVSVHLSKELGDFRFFSEIEFEYGTKLEGEGGTALKTARGEVKLEQAWGEYVWRDWLALRGGLILTPGHWNVNHYPNIVLSTRRPLMVRKVYPESFAGLMAYGTWLPWREEGGITYQAYAGNGVSDFFPRGDPDENKAIGGRLTFHVPTGCVLDTLDIGVSGYAEEPAGAARVRIWGVDAQVRKGPFELLSELALREAATDRLGLYVQPSFRLDEQWAFFYRYDLLDLHGGDRTQEHSVGVNFRPIPPVSVKVEYFYSAHSRDEEFHGIATSVAIAY